MSKELVEILIGDKYDREAVLFPALLTLCLILFGMWNVVQCCVFELDVISSSNVVWILCAICFVVTIRLLMFIVRTVSKITIESCYYGKDRLHYPSVSMLMPSSTVLSKDLKKEILLKIEKDFGIKIPIYYRKNMNEENFRQAVAEAIGLVRRKVYSQQESEIYRLKNIRYGQCRNMIGGCLVSLLINIPALLYCFANECTYFLTSSLLSAIT